MDEETRERIEHLEKGIEEIVEGFDNGIQNLFPRVEQLEENLKKKNLMSICRDDDLHARIEQLEEHLGKSFKTYDDFAEHYDLHEMSWDELTTEFLVTGLEVFRLDLLHHTDGDGVHCGPERSKLSDDEIRDITRKYIIGLRRKLADPAGDALLKELNIARTDIFGSTHLKVQADRLREWADQLEDLAQRNKATEKPETVQ